jgi:hypothetical protein
MRKYRLIFIAPVALAALALFLFAVGEIVRYLWNWLTPPLFGWHQITYWQALGVLVLCRVLFGGHGIRGPKGPGMNMRGRMADRLADRVASRWQQMTPEEQNRFRERFRQRCGGGTGDSTPVG